MTFTVTISIKRVLQVAALMAIIAISFWAGSYHATKHINDAENWVDVPPSGQLTDADIVSPK